MTLRLRLNLLITALSVVVFVASGIYVISNARAAIRRALARIALSIRKTSVAVADPERRALCAIRSCDADICRSSAAIPAAIFASFGNTSSRSVARTTRSATGSPPGAARPPQRLIDVDSEMEEVAELQPGLMPVGHMADQVEAVTVPLPRRRDGAVDELSRVWVASSFPDAPRARASAMSSRSSASSCSRFG